MNSFKPSRRRLVRKVSLRFFQDEANGEWGLTHSDTQNGRNDESFNAFWDGRGLFHDVFEHAHEHTDKHFRGWFAMNIGGEVAAMGSLWYYFDACNFHSRLESRYFSPQDSTVAGTLDMMQAAIEHGTFEFGTRLESNVPTQKRTDDEGLEDLIQSHFSKLSAMIPNKNGRGDEDISEMQDYKTSCTLEKLADLYRYGYRMAAKLVPYTYSNGNTLDNFVRVWNDFCKQNKAEDLAMYYHGLDVKIYRDSEGNISWRADFTPQPGDTEFERRTLEG